MKAHFMFVMLACAALFCGTGYADRATSVKRSRPGSPAKSSLPKPLPKPLPKRPAHLESTAIRPRPVRPPGRVATVAPPLKSVRHHGPNPGAIDGKMVQRRP